MIAQSSINHHLLQNVMFEMNTPAVLVDIMAHMQYPKALYTTSRLVKVLAVDPNNKAALVQCGAFFLSSQIVDPPSNYPIA